MNFCTGIPKTREEQLIDSNETDNLPVTIGVAITNEEDEFSASDEADYLLVTTGESITFINQAEHPDGSGEDDNIPAITGVSIN
jgi:hypothetical protein